MDVSVVVAVCKGVWYAPNGTTWSLVVCVSLRAWEVKYLAPGCAGQPHSTFTLSLQLLGLVPLRTELLMLSPPFMDPWEKPMGLQ